MMLSNTAIETDAMAAWLPPSLACAAHRERSAEERRSNMSIVPRRGRGGIGVEGHRDRA